MQTVGRRGIGNLRLVAASLVAPLLPAARYGTGHHSALGGTATSV